MCAAWLHPLRVPELRNRILFTLGLIVVARLAAAIPCPGVNPRVLGEFFQTVIDQQAQGSVLGMFNLFSGGALENCALGSLGVMPYISASIMMQLLTSVVPSLAKAAREEGGRQKMSQYARVLTLGLCLIQGYLLAKGFERPETIPFLHGIGAVIARLGMPLVAEPGLGFELLCVLSLSAGTMMLMWLGERITDNGLGNGVSVLIMIGIVSRLPVALLQGGQKVIASGGGPFVMLAGLVFLGVVVAATVAMTQGVRRVQVRYVRQVRGKGAAASEASFLPLKVNYAGVMPIIFAQALLIFPGVILGFLFPSSRFAAEVAQNLGGGWLHYLLSAALIVFFSYFWVATQFNPVQIADDLQKHGGFLPGIRPGKDTADFLDATLTRLTLAGAALLAVISMLPLLVQQGLKIPSLTAQFFGGTSLLILVGVVLDTIRQGQTHLLTRHYDAFTRRGRQRRGVTVPMR